jgi:hypothetical protein
LEWLDHCVLLLGRGGRIFATEGIGGGAKDEFDAIGDQQRVAKWIAFELEN